MVSHDDTEGLVAAVRAAYASADPLEIRGGGTRRHLGRAPSGTALSVGGHSGLVEYDPSEFVVTVRAGTRVDELAARLAEAGQVLAVDVPRLGAASTIGGAIATGLSGPSRPYTGALRDIVLGARVISGTGEVLNFGGRVLKNVAGFDVSRLMVGAYGTLGLILDVTLRLAPRPEVEEVRQLACAWPQARSALAAWEAALPLSGACYERGVLSVRLSGTERRVAKARAVIGGDPGALTVFTHLRDLSGDFFAQGGDLWRLLVPPDAPWDPVETVIDWGGAQRYWMWAGEVSAVYAQAQAARGQAMRVWGRDRGASPWATPPPATQALMARVKAALDPRGILNRGRLYPDW